MSTSDVCVSPVSLFRVASGVGGGGGARDGGGHTLKVRGPQFYIQSGPYGCWVSWETSLSTTQSGPYGCWVSWETSLSTTQSGPYGC